MNERHSSIQTYLTTHLPHYLNLLQKMVSINSFTQNQTGVNQLGELTSTLFAEFGFSAQKFPPSDTNLGDHLILEKKGTGTKQIALVSHLDTVFSSEEEENNQFFWREEGDRIYGPGTVDIKGGTVAIYMLLQAIAHFAPQQFAEISWLILFDSAEEIGSAGFNELALSLMPPEKTLACLVFEGGKKEEDAFYIVVTRKGMAVYEIEVNGRASHAGTAPDLGANAIVQIAQIIEQLHALNDSANRISCNVGLVTGGSVANRVPHQASALVEMRAFTPESYRATDDQIKAMAHIEPVRSDRDGYPCQIDIKTKLKNGPWPRNKGTDWLFSIWQEAATEIGWSVVPEERGGLSDGNYFWAQIPTLDGLGPHGGNAHCSERSTDGSKDQEYVDYTSLIPKTILNYVAILQLIKESAVQVD